MQVCAKRVHATVLDKRYQVVQHGHAKRSESSPMRTVATAIVSLAVLAPPAAAATITINGSGIVQRAFLAGGAGTTLASGDPFAIRFTLDTDSLVLVGSNENSAGYRFAASNVTALIGSYAFQPASAFGTVSFSRGFSFFGQPFSEPALVQSFSFRGLGSEAPFTAPGGIAGTSLTLNSFFRYDGLPSIDPSALTNPALAARSDFSFGVIPIAGSAARASVSGPASASFIISAVPEPGIWLTMILGFGLVGAAVRRGNNKVTTTVAFV